MDKKNTVVGDQNKNTDSSRRYLILAQILGTLFVLTIGILLIITSLGVIDESKSLLKDSLLQLGLAIIVATVTYYAYQVFIKYKSEDIFKKNIDNAFTSSVDLIDKKVDASTDKNKELFDNVNDNIQNVNININSIKERTQLLQKELGQLYQYNAILEGAKSEMVGMVEIFTDRNLALGSIYSEIKEEKEVKLMGIALSDFFSTKRKGQVAGEYDEFSINSYLDKGDKTIKVLLLNPYSEYAQIRAAREDGKEAYNEFINYHNSTLFRDVNRSLTFIEDKIKDLEKQDISTKITVKLYKSTNPIFLVITSKYVYYEHYNLGIKGEIGGGSSPVIKLRIDSTLAKDYISHFTFIFDSQSQEPDDIKIRGLYGAYYNIRESKLINLFTKRDCPTLDKRIRWLINAQQDIDICGISLRDFLHPNGIFDQVFKDLRLIKSRESKMIRVLLLDPFSESGQLRSRREQAGDKEEAEGMIRGNLFQDIIRSLRHHSELEKAYRNIKIEVKLYSAAPSCFIFRTNESIILEQYHFGTKKEDFQQDPKLSEETSYVARKIPISEYSADCIMYQELSGHFNFIYKTSSIAIPKEKWAENYKIDLKSFTIE